LQMEKNSVLYYTGLQAIVPKDLGGDQIEAITAQEMAHVTLLSRQLDELPLTD
jgi:rubrerythrin